MTQREKLIELIINTPRPKQQVVIGGRTNGKVYRTVGTVADHLIENGVIVLPCKVGDTVYKLGTTFKCQCKYKGYNTLTNTPIMEMITERSYYVFEDTAPNIEWILSHYYEFGKSIFTTKKAAKIACELLKRKGETK